MNMVALADVPIPTPGPLTLSKNTRERRSPSTGSGRSTSAPLGTSNSLQRVQQFVSRFGHAWDMAQKQNGCFLYPIAVFPDVDTGRKLIQQ